MGTRRKTLGTNNFFFSSSFFFFLFTSVFHFLHSVKMIPLNFCFVLQFVMYVAVPKLYIDLINKRSGGFEDPMGMAIYPDIDFSSPGTRHMSLILMSFVLRHLILLLRALTDKKNDASFRAAARQDAMLFHLLQPPILILLSDIDLSIFGAKLFYGVHTFMFLIWLLSDSPYKGVGKAKVKSRKEKGKEGLWVVKSKRR